MNLKRLFQDFNPSKFIVFLCLFFFVLLLSLRLDSLILWSYWAVFLPLWLWKLTTISGAISGIVVWCRHPQSRSDSLTQFKAMILSSCLQCLLLVFELLACYKMESDARGGSHAVNSHMWLFVFIPLILLSIVSIGICIWALKNERGFELELTCASNVLLFIFLALRLDELIKWSWAVVLIPLWIVMSVAIILVIYGIILALILLKSPEVLPEARRNSVSNALAFAAVVFPLLVFEILLAQKLDHQLDARFISVSVPLLLAIIVLACMAFGARTGNQWWFGIRKDFCQFVLEVCPPLQEYGNVEYKFPHSEEERRESGNEDGDEVGVEILRTGRRTAGWRPGDLDDGSDETTFVVPGGQRRHLGSGSAVIPPVLRIDVPD